MSANGLRGLRARFLSVSCCFVCASVRGDNPRVLASGLSPIQTNKPHGNFFIAPFAADSGNSVGGGWAGGS